MTSTNSTGSKQFDALGLKKIINGRSWVTILGGSRMPEEVQDAMTDAANTFIDFHELNKRAGTLIAEYTGAEAGLVVAGASAGLLVQAAACMAGSDPDRILQLPDTNGMKDEILIFENHRFFLQQNVFAGLQAKRTRCGLSGTRDRKSRSTAPVLLLL